MKDTRSVPVGFVRPAGIRFCRPAGLVVALLGPVLAAFPAEAIDLQLHTQDKANVAACDKPVKKSVTVTGPAVIRFYATLTPYRAAGTTMDIPLQWARLNYQGVPGKFSGFRVVSLGPPPFDALPTGAPYGTEGLFQGGQKVGISPRDKVNAEVKASYGVKAGERLELEIQLAPLCTLYGSTWTQFGQSASASVMVEPGGGGGGGGAKPPPTAVWKPGAALRVQITPAQTTLKGGQKVKTTANVSGGRTPYRFEWSIEGKRSDWTKGWIVWTLGQRLGPRVVKVVVTDSSGARTEGKAGIEVK